MSNTCSGFLASNKAEVSSLTTHDKPKIMKKKRMESYTDFVLPHMACFIPQ
jgi:hypothetical protein